MAVEALKSAYFAGTTIMVMLSREAQLVKKPGGFGFTAVRGAKTTAPKTSCSSFQCLEKESYVRMLACLGKVMGQ